MRINRLILYRNIICIFKTTEQKKTQTTAAAAAAAEAATTAAMTITRKSENYVCQIQPGAIRPNYIQSNRTRPYKPLSVISYTCDILAATMNNFLMCYVNHQATTMILWLNYDYTHGCTVIHVRYRSVNIALCIQLWPAHEAIVYVTSLLHSVASTGPPSRSLRLLRI